jgi:hypothetical protein
MLDTILPQLQDMAATPVLVGVQRVLSAAAVQATDAEQGGSQPPGVSLPLRPPGTGCQDQDPQGSKHHRAPQSREGRQSPRSTGGMLSLSSSSKHGTQQTEFDLQEFLEQRHRNPPLANTQALRQHISCGEQQAEGSNHPVSTKAPQASVPILANFAR